MNATLTNISERIRYPDDTDYGNKDAYFGFLITAFLGSALSALAKLIGVPPNVPAGMLGLLVGLIYRNHVDILYLDTYFLLSTYVPLIIAQLTYTNDNYLLLKSIPQLLFIVVIGNALFIPSLALLINILQPKSIDFIHVISMAIQITPNQVTGIPNIGAGVKNLETLMVGESILTISLCLTMFVVTAGVYDGIIVTYYQMICVGLRHIGLAIPVGYFFGLLTSACIRQLYNDSLNALCGVLGTTYFIYYFCELIVGCNGSVALFITLYMLSQERTRLLPKVDQDIVLCINICYYFTTLMFGVVYISAMINLWMLYAKLLVLIESIATYIIGNVLRLLIFLLMSPILSRLGYGFDFTSLVTMFWSIQKGPLNIMLAICSAHPYLLEAISYHYFSYVVTYVFCSYTINGTTLNLFLKRFGLIEVSNRRKANIVSSINTINETSSRILVTIKLNRVYSDANWPVIYEQTQLKNPFPDFELKQSSLVKDSIVCHVCKGIVPLRLTAEECSEIQKDVTLRILKAQRVSFVRQFETGLLSKKAVRQLLQAIEIAMDSADMDINVESVFSHLYSKKHVVFLAKTLKKLLTIDSSIKIPKSGFRKVCYTISTSIYFEAFIHLVTVLDVGIIISRLPNHPRSADIDLIVIDCVCILCLVCETLLTAMSYAHASFLQHFKIFFKNHWNKIDFVILIISVADIIISILIVDNRVDSKHRFYVRWIRLLSCVKLIRILSRTYPYWCAFFERRRDFKQMKTVSVGMAIIISCEQVMEILPFLTQQVTIRAELKAKLLKTRSIITQKIMDLAKERPLIQTTLKTKQVLRAIFKFLLASALELRTSGIIDEYEYQKIINKISIKHKSLHTLRLTEVTQPKSIFYECPWLNTSDILGDFIYKSVQIKLFNAGDILCERGARLTGIYITINGYFKITYIPTSTVLSNLQINGELPIKEYLEYMRYEDDQEDYILSGNRIGELAFLTNRMCSCTIVSEVPTQAFFIPKEILQSAMILSPDPVLGLCARIWKTILMGLARRILITTSSFKSASEELIDYALDRAIVPSIGYYTIIALSQVVDFVLLLEGIIVDFRTREIFTAPCAIPRHVTKLIMPTSSLISVHNTEPKVMFFPMHNIDSYEMMQTIERNSELVPNTTRILTDQVRRQSKRLNQGHMFNIKKTIAGGMNQLIVNQ